MCKKKGTKTEFHIKFKSENNSIIKILFLLYKFQNFSTQENISHNNFFVKFLKMM